MFSTIVRTLGQSVYRPRLLVAVNTSLENVKNLSSFETLSVTVPKPFVYRVELNRPDNYNALNNKLFFDIKQCFEEINDDPDCRVVVLTASGKHFSSGIDLNDMMKFGQDIAQFEDIARKAKVITKTLTDFQKSFTSLELCAKPVISAIHSACIGAAVELILASDIRYCSDDAWFQIKEVDIGMAADIGSLQRFQKVIGNISLVRELCYTARKMQSEEALNCGLVSKRFKDKESLISGALSLAETIAEKSPVAVQVTKQTLVFSLDHTTQEGLDYIAVHNQAMLQSEDFINACIAQATRGDKPVFAKL